MPTDMKTLMEQAGKEIREVSPEEADQQQREHGHVIIDARQPYEYEEASARRNQCRDRVHPCCRRRSRDSGSQGPELAETRASRQWFVD